MSGLELEVQRSTSCGDLPGDEQFRAWAEAALAVRAGDYNLAIRIVDEAEGRQHNHDYRGKDNATNVLSFPAELPEGLPDELRDAQLGDLLMCAPVVAREAQEQNLPESDHWAHLVVHGVLHLLGYDHQQIDEAGLMESLETNILTGLGIADPYRDEK